MKFFENSQRYYVAIIIMFLLSIISTIFGRNETESIFLFGLSFFSLYYIYVSFISESIDWGKQIDLNTVIIYALWAINVILWALFTQFIIYIKTNYEIF